MFRNFRLQLMSLVFATACGVTVKSKSPPPADQPNPTPTPAPSPSNKGNGDANPQTGALELGKQASVQGSVAKDENGFHAITKVFSFSLAEPTKLRVRKSLAMGNCGAPTAAFVILQGETQLDDVTIDPEKNYGGVPAEVYANTTPAGAFSLVAYIIVPNECPGLFFYDFYLEKAP
jgi:hypothetical protein